MYQAELQGKLSSNNENREDILTSDVFSFFKYADRELFLYRFLTDIGINIKKVEAKKAEFKFWPTYEEIREFSGVVKPYCIIIPGELHFLEKDPLIESAGTALIFLNAVFILNLYIALKRKSIYLTNLSIILGYLTAILGENP